MDIDSIALTTDDQLVWKIAGEHRLASLRIARTRCTSAALALALRSSEMTLESLILDAIERLDSDAFLAGRAWAALRVVEWHQSRIDRLGRHLPATLAALSLRETTVAQLELGDAWPQRLASIDCVGSTTSDAVAAHLLADPAQLIRVGRSE